MNWYLTKISQSMYSSVGTISIRSDDSVIILADEELTRYYISRYNRSRPYLSGQIMQPKWKGHITVIPAKYEKIEKNEENIKYLNEINNKSINFEYDTTLVDNEKHFWLKVNCEEAKNIRERLNFSREPVIPFHLTIGVTTGNENNELV